MKKRIYTRSWRARKAYSTAFVVAVSYFWLLLLEKIWGRAFYNKRIMALHLRNAHRIKKAILDLQGLFVKVGQLLSIMTNFLPEAFHEPLESLQDQLPPRPFEEVQRHIEQELNAPISQLFAHIEPVPIAAASIGQAHRATLTDGTKVVVKAQHHNIEKIAAIDLEIIRRLTLLVGFFFKVKGIEYLYSQVRQMIEAELDFEQEAASMNRIRENLKDVPNLLIPTVFEAYSTKKVLTTAFCEGVKISNTKQLKAWQLDCRSIGNRLLESYCKMVFLDGFYHADPHPGNILIQPDGTIVLLDFGAVATLDPAMQRGIPELIEAAVKNDTDAIIRIMTSLGFIAEGKEAVQIAEKLIETFRNFLQNEIEIQGLNFKNFKVNPLDSSLVKVKSDIGLRNLANTIQVPKDYVLLNRMMTLLLGICNTLDTDLNPLEVVRPYVQKFVLGEQQDWLKFVSELLQRTISNTLALPSDLRNALRKLEKGEVEIHIKSIETGANLLYQLGQQLIFTLLSIAALAVGIIFYQSGQVPFSQYSFGAMGLFLILLLRAFWQGRQLHRRS